MYTAYLIGRGPSSRKTYSVVDPAQLWLADELKGRHLLPPNHRTRAVSLFDHKQLLNLDVTLDARNDFARWLVFCVVLPAHGY